MSSVLALVVFRILYFLTIIDIKINCRKPAKTAPIDNGIDLIIKELSIKKQLIIKDKFNFKSKIIKEHIQIKLYLKQKFRSQFLCLS